MMEKHGKTVASKEALEKENAVLQTTVNDARQESHKLQSSLMKAESEKEQLKLEIDSLERDKVSIQGGYEQSKKEISELQSRVQTLSSKVLLVTKENGNLDCTLQNTLAERSRESLHYSKLEQEKTILEKSNKWLQEELDRKVQLSNEERQKATQRIVELSGQYQESQNKLEYLETDNERLKSELTEQQERLKNASKQLKDTKDSFAEKQESFEQELALAQRMAQLYRESSEEYAKRTMELEGIVNELKAHMEESSAAYNETVSKLENDYRSALEKAQEEREIREKVVAAAAAGSFDISTPSRDDLPVLGQEESHRTSAEIYAKLIETEERLRVEKLKTREKEIYFEDLLIEVEKRANLLQDQQVEFERMKSSHVKLLGDIEELSTEKRRLTISLKNAESRTKDLDHEKLSLEQQVKDLGQQVARLLHTAANESATAIGSFAGGNARDVTTHYLVEFSSIEELQQQNQKLLKVNRELSIAAEATKEEAKKEIQSEYEERVDQLRNDLEDLKRNRQHAEEIFEQVVRQRDTLRNLLQGAGGDLAAGRELYEKSLGYQEIGRTSNPQIDTMSINPENLQYREMYEDLEKKFEDYKRKSIEEYSTLEKDLASTKNDLISMKKQISQAKAECEYENERSKRLSVSIDSHQKQVDSLLASNAKYQALVNETEKRLSITQQSLFEAEDELRKLTNTVVRLDSEKTILSEAEKRLTEEASGLSQEKFRIAAELDVLRKQHNQLESDSAKEISKQQGTILKLENDLSDAKRELSMAKGRVDYAHGEILQLKEELKNTTAKLEGKIEAKEADLSEMQRRASSAEAKADILQEAVRKSEEKVARLEIERNARLPMSQGGTNNVTEIQMTSDSRDVDVQIKDLQVEIKILREELVSAQEALAASTGHAKQYEAIAQTAEEALKSSQSDIEKFKRDASNRVSSIESEVKRLRMEISKKDITIKELKQEEQNMRQECDNLKHMVQIEKSNSKEAMQQTSQNLEKERMKVTELSKDVEKLQKEIDEVRKAYDAEVVAHGDAVRRVASTEATLDAVQSRLNAVLSDLNKERDSRKQIESEQKSKIDEQSQQIHELQMKIEQMSKLRDSLQQELESLTNSGAPNVSSLSNSMKLLRQEREAAELNLSLCEREVARLRQENSIAKRAVEEARAQLSAQIERQNSKRAEQHENQINYMEQFNITRESNIALRSDNAEKQKQIQHLEIQVKEIQSTIDPLHLKIKEKESELSNVKDELKVALESVHRWEQRSKALSEKASSLDLEEHEQLKADLDQTKKQLSSCEEKISTLLKEKEEIESRLKNTETIAHRANANANTMKKQLEEQRKKAEASNKSASEISKRQQEERDRKIQEIIEAKELLETKVQEMSKKEDMWKEKAKNLLNNCEKSNLAKKQAEAQVKSLKDKVESLENEVATLKSTNEQVDQQSGDMNTEAPESVTKRKIEEEEILENAAKRLRPAAEEFTPSSQQHCEEEQDHNVQIKPERTTGATIVDRAIEKAIESQKEILEENMDLQDTSGDKITDVNEHIDVVEEQQEGTTLPPASEEPPENGNPPAAETRDLLPGCELSQGNVSDMHVDNKVSIEQLEEKEEIGVAKDAENIADTIEEKPLQGTENENDVDPSTDAAVPKDDAKQTDGEGSKPESPKRKSKRTKIQWKDTSKQ